MGSSTQGETMSLGGILENVFIVRGEKAQYASRIVGPVGGGIISKFSMK